MSSRICILLPVLNERENVSELLRRIEEALRSHDHLVCIVDDGSRDGTIEVIEQAIAVAEDRLHLIRRFKTSRGSQRGAALHAALLWAMTEAKSDIFVEMDGDLSHRPEELEHGIALVATGKTDVAIASKYLSGSRVTNRPVGRRIVSRVCNYAVRILLDASIRDYSNGFRFYNGTAARAIAETKIRYGSPIYLTEVMALWQARKLRIVEFPTVYIGRNEGLSKLRIMDLIKAGLGVFEIAYRRHIAGFGLATPARRLEGTESDNSKHGQTLAKKWLQ